MYLYERIFEDLRRAVDEGEIGPGERLPSIREVAERYGCNKLTAQRAFDHLSTSGRIENRVGSGSYARYPQPMDESKGDFSSAVLSESFFPYDEAGSILASLLASERGRVFSAPSPLGEDRLLESLARRFDLPRDTLLVTGGGQQGLDLVRRLFSERGEPLVLVEEPTYPGALSLFRPKASVAFGNEGPDPAAVAAFFGAAGSGARFFYTVPELHNPTGLRHSLERKKEIARLAAFLDFTIIEDDYLSELLPERGQRYADLIPERTIWIKSLSKTMAPGIRIGVLSAPPQFLPRLHRLRMESDPGPSTWLQLFAAGIIDSGLFDRHLDRVRVTSEARRAELLGLLADLPGFLPQQGGQGFNLWVATGESAKGPAAGWAEGWRFGRGTALRHYLRLSLMSVGEAEWPEAKKRLRASLKAAFPQG
ncbi:MAG: PLP-dependent aminotransferase family protein [Spirochaetota bacterium]